MIRRCMVGVPFSFIIVGWLRMFRTQCFSWRWVYVSFARVCWMVWVSGVWVLCIGL